MTTRAETTVRMATFEDIETITTIYNRSILSPDAFVYAETPASKEQQRQWFEERRAKNYPVLVAEDGPVVAGFATFNDFRPASGYRYSVEHSIHINPQHHGKGLGAALIYTLLACASDAKKHVMIGVIDSENLRSIRFHERLGFRETGRMPEIAKKFGQWRTVLFMQRKIESLTKTRNPFLETAT